MRTSPLWQDFAIVNTMEVYPIALQRKKQLLLRSCILRNKPCRQLQLSRPCLASNPGDREHGTLWCVFDGEFLRVCSWRALSAHPLQQESSIQNVHSMEWPKVRADILPSSPPCRIYQSASWECFGQRAVYLSKRLEWIAVASRRQLPLKELFAYPRGDCRCFSTTTSSSFCLLLLCFRFFSGSVFATENFPRCIRVETTLVSSIPYHWRPLLALNKQEEGNSWVRWALLPAKRENPCSRSGTIPVQHYC